MTASRESDTRELDLLIEEYRALRTEIDGALTAQHTTLSWGMAALALMVIALANAWDKTPSLISLALMTVIPGGIYLLLTVWGMEVSRMTRAGSYLASYLEPRLAGAAHLWGAGPVWEQWIALREKPKPPWTGTLIKQRIAGGHQRSRHLRFEHGTIIGLLVFMAFTSWAVGAYRFYDLAQIAAKHATHDRKPSEVRWYFNHWIPEEIGLGLAFLLLPTLTGSLMLRDGRHDFPIDQLPTNPYPALPLTLGPPSKHQQDSEPGERSN